MGSVGVLTYMISIFVAGFLGSWHCGFMCGPIACYYAEQKKLWTYQIGRMISYTILGIFSGSISQFLFKSENKWVRYAAIALIFVGLVYGFFFNEKIKFSGQAKWFFKFRNSSFWMGLLTVLLPCGWLYSFVFAAAATQSVYAGALVMWIFWLSTLPSLTIGQVMLSRMIEKTNARTRWVSRVVLLLASVYSLVLFLTMH